MKQKITRIDGIEYERKTKKANYDTQIYIRTSQEVVDKLRELSNKKDIKYSNLIRTILEEYIEKEV